MNKESSIKQLKRIKQDMTHADDVNALDFAIRFMGNKTLEKIRAEIEEYKSRQLTLAIGVEDLENMERQGMILNEAIERYTSNAEYERIHGNLQGCLEFRQLAEWLKDYKRLLEQEPCDDAINRQAVHELVADYDLSMGQVVKGIHALLPVNPQPKTKTGHWIETDKYEPYWYRCSECCRGSDDITDYCPNCGARMQEVGE